MILLDFSGSSVVMFHGDLPYSSKDILKKLETMDEENIIGAGGFGTVYKLAMDDGNVFALKRIVKTNEGLDRFFDRELDWEVLNIVIWSTFVVTATLLHPNC
jgi:hypothetical protein